MAEQRINFSYPRKEELLKAVEDAKAKGHRISMSLVIETLLNHYLDHSKDKALKAPDLGEYLKALTKS
jgi:hypothetical protein